LLAVWYQSAACRACFQVVDGEQVAAGQVLIDHFRQVVRGQFDHGEDLRDGQRADGVLRARVVEARQLQSHLLAHVHVEVDVGELA